MTFVQKIAQIVAMLIFGIRHSFGDTLQPRVHTASQQAHGKLKIDSVRFYTRKFLHECASTPGKTNPGKESNLVDVL